MAATNKNKDSLSLLMAATMALPGIASAQISDPNVRSDKIVLSYTRGQYQEPATGQSYLNSHKVLLGDFTLLPSPRMDVATDQLSLTVPIYDRFEIKLNAIRDITSGASVITNIPFFGQTVPLVSGATIRDRRQVVDVTGAYYGDQFYADVNIGESSENDYKSKFISTNYRHYFNDKSTTLILGASFNDDTTWGKFDPTDPFSFPSVYNKRHGHELLAGVSQILDANSVATFIIGNNYNYGFLNEQYRSAQIFADNNFFSVLDKRPDTHSQWTAVGRYSHYFEKTNSALHAEYRYAYDSWRAHSHTLDTKWRVDLGSGWTISPGLRYYTQQAADFYSPFFTQLPDPLVFEHGFFVVSPTPMSSDYRLAGFGVISPSLEVSKLFDAGLLLRASYQRNIRKRKYELFSSTGGSFDDYNSNLFSVSVAYAF